MVESTPDCASCKVIGAGGCFAGAMYAFYQRAHLPSTASNRNRQWLAMVGAGVLGAGLGIVYSDHLAIR